MTSFQSRSSLAFVVTALALGIASPALAGTCTTPGTNPLTNAPTMPKNVTDTVIGSLDLAEQVNFAGHDLRLRKLVVQPGGIVPLHSHEGRPALILTASGSITEYRNSCARPILHKAGEVAEERNGYSHYWVNTGKVPTVLYSSDVKAK